ncbi:DUF4132 domain-containing protein [Streptomyces sp. NPDC085946]|uniref:DUF4132 domain-containing protein n=1 Tax=Streptomyces sp. NPDC085946 TaxID=3365744 RepID=UPI0037D36D6D
MTGFRPAASPLGRMRDRIAGGDPDRTVDEALRALPPLWAVTPGRDGWDDVAALLRGLPAPRRRDLVRTLADRFARPGDGPEDRCGHLALSALLSDGLDEDPLAAERAKLLDDLGRGRVDWYQDRFDALVRAELAAGRPLAPPVVAVVRRAALETYRPDDLVDLAGRLTDPVLNVGEAWSDQALRDATGADWQALLRHALTATASRPTAAWDERARALVAALGTERVRGTVLSWLALVGRPRTLPMEGRDPEPATGGAYDPCNATALRGLAWLLSLLPPHPGTVRALGALVETSLRKLPGIGPRSPKVANAGVVALARVDGEAALAELARLAARVTSGATAKLLDTALRSRAAARGLGREEIEELAVPAHGLTGAGRAEHRLGDTTAVLEIRGSRAALTWRTASGKTVKGAPAAVRQYHAGELKELRAAVKDIDRTLSAQSERLDRQFLARRTWAYAAWRERLLDHPLLGTLARRLLWTVDGTTVGHADGALRTLAGEPVAPGAEVGLWHPVDHEPGEIAAWRDRLERHGITQPFKQVHREVYRLTDAERAARTYSDRFAGRVLRQHRFHSLAALRGWRNQLRLAVDDEVPPATRELPAWGLRAEFRITSDVDGDAGPDITGPGTFTRVRTGQVRFYPIDAPRASAHSHGDEYRVLPRAGAVPDEPLPLEDVPPLVLSEVLRDVDLFVRVADADDAPAAP